MIKKFSDGVTMKICVLFRFTVYTVSIKELEESKHGTNIKDKIAAYINMSEMESAISHFLLKIDDKLEKLEDKYDDGSFVIIANMDDLEYSNLKIQQDKLTKSYIIEKEEATEALNVFYNTVATPGDILGELAIQSCDNMALKNHLKTRSLTLGLKLEEFDEFSPKQNDDREPTSRADEVMAHSGPLLNNLRRVSIINLLEKM